MTSYNPAPSSASIGLPGADDLDALDISDIRRFRDGTHLPLFARMRDEAPVHFCRESPFGPYWSITRAEDILAINADHARFSSHHNVIIGDIPEDFHYPAFMVRDPPTHGFWRKIVAPGFSKAHMAGLADRCRDHVSSVLDDLPRNAPFDWVREVSAKLTPWMIGALFDLPENEVATLIEWSNWLIDFEAEAPGHPKYETRQDRMRAFASYLKAQSAKRRGSGATDLLSLLVAEPHGDQMLNDLAHFMGTVSLVVGAGETTRSAASAMVVAMDRFPAEWQRIRTNPALIGNAVQEVIRWQTPLAHMRRTARIDVELRNAHIRAGDRVVLWYCSGNRDAALFANGDTFDVGRRNARKHLSYGFGIHRCIGRHAAELQLGILLDGIVKQFERIEVLGTPTRTVSNYFTGFDEVRVRIG